VTFEIILAFPALYNSNMSDKISYYATVTSQNLPRDPRKAHIVLPDWIKSLGKGKGKRGFV